MNKAAGRLFLAALIVLMAVPAVGVSIPPLISNPDGREVISLDGEWRTIIDPSSLGRPGARTAHFGKL